jgi:alpha-tubulin suppressor-like RCC1 family protein
MRGGWFALIAAAGCASSPPGAEDTDLGVPVGDTDAGADTDVVGVDTSLDTDVAPPNHPPLAPTFTLSPAAPVTGDTLMVDVQTPADPDGDPVTVRVTWEVLSGPAAGKVLQGSVVDALYVQRGQVWEVRVQADDGVDRSPVVTDLLTVGDAIPVIVDLQVTPSAPRAGAALLATATVVDPDRDTAAWVWRWSINGVVALEGLDQARLSGFALVRGDEVSVTLDVDDGYGGTAQRTLGPIVVQNTPPPAPRVAITPSAPRPGAPLRCRVTGAAPDTDGDVVRHSVRWLRDGAPFVGTTTDRLAGDTVPEGLIADGERWTCAALPDDGVDVGPEAAAWVEVGGPDPVIISLDIGLGYACAAEEDGDVRCWGYDDNRKAEPPDLPMTALALADNSACGLGLDGTISCWGLPGARSTPPEGVFVQLDAAVDHTCARALDGSLSCWGADYLGQLAPPEGVFTDLAVSQSRACALDEAGTLVCWGLFSAGLPVPSGAFDAVSLGSFHGCALTAPDHQIRCWGDGSAGQTASPQGAGFSQLVSGATHSCALDATGRAHCWGSDYFHQLELPDGEYDALWAGASNTCAHALDGGLVCVGSWQGGVNHPPVERAVAVDVGNLDVCWLDSSGGHTCVGVQGETVSPPSLAPWTQLDVGLLHGCAVEDSGAVDCWGYDLFGETEPAPGLYDQVAVGDAHSCGLKTNGNAVCWGSTSSGATSAAVGPFFLLTAGVVHTCAVHTDGRGECWGANGDGQLNVPQGSVYSDLSAGGYHTCGVRTDGGLDCWGNNVFAQSVPPSGLFTAVSSGLFHSCALRADQSLTCWGDNTFHRAEAPSGLYRSLSSGSTFSCAIDDDDRVHCWGGWRRDPLGQ